MGSQVKGWRLARYQKLENSPFIPLGKMLPKQNTRQGAGTGLIDQIASSLTVILNIVFGIQETNFNTPTVSKVKYNIAKYNNLLPNY